MKNRLALLQIHPLVRGGRRWFLRHEAQVSAWKAEYAKSWLTLVVCGLVIYTCGLWIIWEVCEKELPPEKVVWFGVLTMANGLVFMAYTFYRILRESIEHHFDRNLRHIVNDWKWYARYEDVHERDRVEREKLRVKTGFSEIKVDRLDEAL